MLSLRVSQNASPNGTMFWNVDNTPPTKQLRSFTVALELPFFHYLFQWTIILYLWLIKVLIFTVRFSISRIQWFSFSRLKQRASCFPEDIAAMTMRVVRCAIEMGIRQQKEFSDITFWIFAFVWTRHYKVVVDYWYQRWKIQRR